MNFIEHVVAHLQSYDPHAKLQYTQVCPIIATQAPLIQFILFPLNLLTNKCDQQSIIDYALGQINEKQRVICIWEDIWLGRSQQIQSRLASLFGVITRLHARETQLVPLDQHQFNEFMTDNHLLGTTKVKFRYGLMHRHTLVAVAGFSAIRTYYRTRGTSRSAELIRFANIDGHTVRGGLSKLIKYFINHHDVQDIMTYADLDWSMGFGYTQLGFEFIEVGPPNLFWYSHSKQIRYTNQQLERLQLKISSDLTPCFNLGNVKYILFNN